MSTYIDVPQRGHDFGNQFVGDLSHAWVVNVRGRRRVLGLNVLGDGVGVHQGVAGGKGRSRNGVCCEAIWSVGRDKGLEDWLYVGVFGPLRAIG